MRFFLPKSSGRLRRRIPAALRCARGTSLVEIIIASFLVGVVSLGMVEFFARGRGAFDQEERKRVATLLAQDALEKTRATDYALIATLSPSTRTIANVTYTIDVTVQTDVPDIDIKTISSTVTWEARPSINRSVRLDTMVYNN